MAEVISTGFVATTENEYFAEETALYQSIDTDWNLDPSTPDGLKIANDAEVFVKLDEAAQAAYNSKDPNKAVGVELNIISSLSGTQRDLGAPSTVTLTLGGVDATFIQAGSIVESSVDGTEWATDVDVTIAGGTASVAASAVVNGATNADVGTLTIIVDSVGGWQTVTNAANAQIGTDPESNPELRLRRAIAVGGPGNNQIDSYLGAIGNVAGVGRFRIYENDTTETDSNSIPANSLAIIVQGGTDLDVATAIFIKKNPGAGLFQAGVPVSVLVTSALFPTNTKDIKFSRPIDDDMIVVVTIINDGTLPAGTDTIIENAIIEYAAGQLVTATTGFNSTGFDIGEDVGVSRLYTPVNSIIGALGSSHISGLTVNGTDLTVGIDFNAISRWTNANITVNIS